VAAGPCVAALTLCIHPLGIQVGQSRLVAQLLQRLGGFGVDKTTATPSPSFLHIEWHFLTRRTQLAGPRVASKAEAGGAINE
jgi:hypothetical protein